MTALLARIVNPIVWRIPGHGARKLYGFSLAEHGSMLDLKAASSLTTSPERSALYLKHMLDETRHARMFAVRSADLRAEEGAVSFGFPKADFENLFDRLGEVRFLAFVHRGERRGRAQFETYRDWFARRGDTKTRAMFDAIVRDETRHESYTRDLLVELSGGEAPARRELARAALWEAWRHWRRLGRFGAEKLYFCVMIVLYGLLAPFMLLAAMIRPAAKGWTLPTSEAESEARSSRERGAASLSAAA